MNPETIITELRRINAWRRGDETVGQPAPGHFGDVLDAAAESLAALVASNTTLRRERREARAELKQRKADVTRMEEYLRNSGRNMDEAQEQIAGRDSKIVTLSADLARVTAELEHHKSVKETLDSAHKELSREHAALRARVAEVEVQAERYRLATLRQDAENMLLQQRNTELVAALREVDEIVNDTNHSAEDRLCAAANRLLNTRAESATPDHIPDAAKMVSATPAKHPDTEILEWLDSAACYRWMIAVGGDREEELHKMIPWKIRDAVRYCIAARKQGGAA